MIKDVRELKRSCLKSWYYTMQLTLQLVSQDWKETSTANCKTHGKSHVTRCNLGLQLAMVSKESIQSLQKGGLHSALCNRCNPRKVKRQVAKRACYALQTYLHEMKIEMKIASCNTSYLKRGKLYSCERGVKFIIISLNFFTPDRAL